MHSFITSLPAQDLFLIIVYYFFVQSMLASITCYVLFYKISRHEHTLSTSSQGLYVCISMIPMLLVEIWIDTILLDNTSHALVLFNDHNGIGSEYMHEQCSLNRHATGYLVSLLLRPLWVSDVIETPWGYLNGAIVLISHKSCEWRHCRILMRTYDTSVCNFDFTKTIVVKPVWLAKLVICLNIHMK